MKLSKHFDKNEFRCQCGCGGENPSRKLIEMLEKLHDLMGAKAIIISSGYRCPSYSVKVGGYRNDAHTCNIAVDCCVKKPDGSYYTSDFTTSRCHVHYLKDQPTNAHKLIAQLIAKKAVCFSDNECGEVIRNWLINDQNIKGLF